MPGRLDRAVAASLDTIARDRVRARSPTSSRRPASPRPTAHRLAVALERHGLLARDDDGRFRLGRPARRLGCGAAARTVRLAAAAGPVLARLVRRDRRERAALRARGRPPRLRRGARAAERPARHRPARRGDAARRGLGRQGAAGVGGRRVGVRRRRARAGGGARRGVGRERRRARGRRGQRERAGARVATARSSPRSASAGRSSGWARHPGLPARRRPVRSPRRPSAAHGRHVGVTRAKQTRSYRRRDERRAGALARQTRSAVAELRDEGVARLLVVADGEPPPDPRLSRGLGRRRRAGARASTPAGARSSRRAEAARACARCSTTTACSTTATRGSRCRRSSSRSPRALLDRFGAVVARDTLAERAWPDGRARRATRSTCTCCACAAASRPLGLEIRTVRSRGYLLQGGHATRNGHVATDARTRRRVARRVRLGIDTGGTFTDVVADDGRVAKVLVDARRSRRARSRGAIDAARRRGASDVLAHGTTVATNALLERRGARVALVATRGLRRRDRDRAAGTARRCTTRSPTGPRRSCRARCASRWPAGSTRAAASSSRSTASCPTLAARRRRGRGVPAPRRPRSRRTSRPSRPRARRAASTSRVLARGQPGVPRVRAHGHDGRRTRTCDPVCAPYLARLARARAPRCS